MLGNKLIGKSLANKKQKIDRQCVYANKLRMHVSCCCFIRNTFIRFATACVRIRKHS